MPTFTFGFGESEKSSAVDQSVGCADSEDKLADATEHSFEVPLRCISYTVSAGHIRRDLHDVRFQLMQEDDLSENENLLLLPVDVKAAIYEGGLKVWEGTHDLLEALRGLDTQAWKSSEVFKVTELGCGVALPGCAVFKKVLECSRAAHLVFADYNDAVLKLVTMPNVLLTWMMAQGRLPLNVVNGKIEFTSALVEEFCADMNGRNISFQFVSGAWSPRLSSIIGHSDLVLAAETIYSPKYLKDFTNVLKEALVPGAEALVAAKDYYFGVGGSMYDFKRLLDEKQLLYETVKTEGNVGRTVLRVHR